MSGTDGEDFGQAIRTGGLYLYIRTGRHIDGILGLGLDGIIGHIEGNSAIVTNRSSGVGAVAKDETFAECTLSTLLP